MTNENIKFTPIPVENPRQETIDPDFNSDKFTLLLNISETNVAEEIKAIAEQGRYEEKAECHITVIGYPNGKKIKRVLEQLYRQHQITEPDFTETWQYLLHSINWQDIKLSQEYHKISKIYKQRDGSEELRESIVQMVEVPGVREFYEK